MVLYDMLGGHTRAVLLVNLPLYAQLGYFHFLFRERMLPCDWSIYVWSVQIIVGDDPMSIVLLWCHVIA